MALDFEDLDLDSEYDLQDDMELDLEPVDESYEPEDFAALGIDPVKPTKARPGSEAKVMMLSARYAAGLPLWNTKDCYEHGPRENELMGSSHSHR
jgi:hypothetical protein